MELGQQALQPLALGRRPRIEPRGLAQHALGVTQVLLLDAVVERLRHGAAAFEHWPQGGVEPAVDRALQQLGGDGEEGQHRDQRETDVGRHQLELEGRAEDAVAALDQQLEQVAQQHEEDDEDQDDVGVPEDEQQDPVGDQEGRQVALAQEEIEEGGEQQQRGRQAADDEPLVLAVTTEDLAQAHGVIGLKAAVAAAAAAAAPAAAPGGTSVIRPSRW